MTKQRRHQIKKQSRGECVICPNPRLTSTRCAIHAARQAEYDRRYDLKRP